MAAKTPVKKSAKKPTSSARAGAQQKVAGGRKAAGKSPVKAVGKAVGAAARTLRAKAAGRPAGKPAAPAAKRAKPPAKAAVKKAPATKVGQAKKGQPAAPGTRVAARSATGTSARGAARPTVPRTSSTLPESEIQAFREHLRAKREVLLAMYHNDLRLGQEASDEPTEDIVDRANNSYSRELSFSISDAERAMLLQLDEALRRLDAGTFGRCAHCSREIARPRLDALPWARLCIDCQELLEKGMLSEN